MSGRTLLATEYRRIAEAHRARATMLAQEAEAVHALAADYERLAVEHEKREASSFWRGRLWECPADTHLSEAEAAEAIGVSVGWMQMHRDPKSALVPIPFSRLDGRVFYVAGPFREWIRANRAMENIVVVERDMEHCVGALARRRAHRRLTPDTNGSR